ncbi:MAG TPA: hypothetical protein VF360_02900 [Candidatus Methanoperedens sp.]
MTERETKEMTVAELTKLLSGFPGDWPVRLLFVCHSRSSSHAIIARKIKDVNTGVVRYCQDHGEDIVYNDEEYEHDNEYRSPHVFIQ